MFILFDTLFTLSLLGNIVCPLCQNILNENSENSPESLNFVADAKPNKHNEVGRFSTTGTNLFSNTFATVGRIFCKALSQYDRTVTGRYLNPKHVIQRALKLPSISHTHFFTRQNFTKPSPCSQFFFRARGRPISARKRHVGS